MPFSVTSDRAGLQILSALTALKQPCFCASSLIYVVLRQVLYVMELQQDLEKGKASFTAVSEFLLTHPVLSFGVRDVAHSRLRHTEVLTAEEDSESMSTGTHWPPALASHNSWLERFS